MKIFNSFSQKLEEFKPLCKNKVTIYVCGITPYDTTHLGHAFTYISFDALIRYLKFKGLQVIYTQNVTDINDRDKDILERAREQNISWKKLAKFWTKKFLEDMKILNWTLPDNFLYASRQIDSIIRIIESLLQKGYAYQINGSVYLDISKFPNFGKLSKFSQTKMKKAAEDFEEDLTCPEKRNPLDITLWRSYDPNQPPHIPVFKSPFGPGRPASRRGSPGGRPGWHIECSAIAISTLGQQIDIHGGGIDLIFPHHEAEIVQSEGATGKIPFARFWIHTGNVFYHGKKMSKSEGDLVMVAELLKKYSPNAIRWLLLSHHWRRNWEYREEDLAKAQKNVQIIEKALASTYTVWYMASQGDAWERKTIGQFRRIMDKNLDTPKALEFLLKLSRQDGTIPKKLWVALGFRLNL